MLCPAGTVKRPPCRASATSKAPSAGPAPSAPSPPSAASPRADGGAKRSKCTAGAGTRPLGRRPTPRPSSRGPQQYTCQPAGSSRRLACRSAGPPCSSSAWSRQRAWGASVSGRPHGGASARSTAGAGALVVDAPADHAQDGRDADAAGDEQVPRRIGVELEQRAARRRQTGRPDAGARARSDAAKPAPGRSRASSGSHPRRCWQSNTTARAAVGKGHIDMRAGHEGRQRRAGRVAQFAQPHFAAR